MSIIGLTLLGIAVLACAAYGIVRMFGFHDHGGPRPKW